MKKTIAMTALLAALTFHSAAAQDQRLIVLELFTSQGCSSCPPADALLKKLSAEDATLLPLSFHVDYWDYLGWKDPYANADNTQRQRSYASALDGKVYTPELVIQGMTGVVGSNERQVRRAISTAQGQQVTVRISFAAANADEQQAVIDGTPDTTPADVWAVTYHPYDQNAVADGENGGRTLAHINNVTSITHLGIWQGGNMRYPLPAAPHAEDKTALLVQRSNFGPVLGAAIIP